MSNTVNQKFIEAQNELLKQASHKGEWSDWKPFIAEAVVAVGECFLKSKDKENTEENMRRFAASLANYASKLYEAAGGEVCYEPKQHVTKVEWNPDKMESL